MRALTELGYQTPTPIQQEMIPHVLDGRDVIGQAQTGTGKTAAFALPLLSRLIPGERGVKILVLAPTRELAVQVTENFARYGKYIKGLRVLPIYGGQGYDGQLRELRRGVQVVVGTPGRIMDHIRRKTLNLDTLSTLVLDEADEMLRMGFFDDVEWIMEQTPAARQVALFSATMPASIRKLASKYLNKPEEITIKQRTASGENIRQRCLVTYVSRKFDALSRILESEESDGIIIFAATKTSTVELTERLESAGHSAVALNGDITQKLRERTVDQFKKGKFNILVATDVAARGLDVDRVSHVINYDAPFDSESYIHRIGRTGRAGRSGEAILFITPREKRLLQGIERTARQKLEMMELPSIKAVNEKRISRFKQRISKTMADQDLSFYTNLISEFISENELSGEAVAAALAHMLQGNTPLLLPLKEQKDRPTLESSSFRGQGPERGRERGGRERGGRSPGKPRQHNTRPESGMERFRVDVGHEHGVKPGNLEGAIANEAG